jgi:LysR family transcriptional regulator, hydrogen peroxide-inducible genes activator
MDMHHIRYFLAVCETLNFTRAAEKCNVTQPALSRAIQQLEEEVGGLLFRRERNLTHLTDLGSLLRPRLRQIMEGVNDVKRDVKKFLTLENANVTLGIMCTIGPTRFTGLLADLRSRYPGVTLRLVEGVPERLSRQLEAGELDIAIMAAGEGFPERLDIETLYRERFLVAFPAGHRFEKMEEVPIAAVDGETYLLRANCEYDGKLSAILRSCEAGVNVAYASEREDWIQNRVAGGLGICFIPEFSAVAPGLLTRPVIDPEVWRDICLVSMSGRRHSPAVASFLKAVRAHDWPKGRYAEPDAV